MRSNLKACINLWLADQNHDVPIMSQSQTSRQDTTPPPDNSRDRAGETAADIKPSWIQSLAAKNEFGWVLLILGLFVAINFSIATRSPSVSVDEPAYCDPAVNACLGQGFTSTAWGEDRNVFWAGNPPLYTGLLYVFFKLFGIGLFQARAVNTLLTAASALLIWTGLRMSGLIRQPVHRVLSTVLVLSGFVTTMAFRTNRYDATMFFVCAAVFFGCCLPVSWRSRYLLIGLCGAFLPFSGVPLLPYTGLMLLITFAVYGWASLGVVVAIGLGLVLGIGALCGFYSHFGALNRFLHNVLPYTAAAGSSHQSHFLRMKLFGSYAQNDGPNLIFSFFDVPTHLRGPPSMFDCSSFLLFILGALIAVKAWRKADAADRRFIWFNLAVALVIPPAIQFVGHYSSYYRWMSYMPLAIAIPRLLETVQSARVCLPRGLVFAVLTLSILLGVPARTLAIIPSWRARTPEPLEKVAAQIVKPSDVVLTGFTSYFAVRPRAKEWFGYDLVGFGMFGSTKNLPTNDITLICSPAAYVSGSVSESFSTAMKAIGGKWKKVPLDGVPGADELRKTRYAVDFYRRDAD